VTHRKNLIIALDTPLLAAELLYQTESDL